MFKYITNPPPLLEFLAGLCMTGGWNGASSISLPPKGSFNMEQLDSVKQRQSNLEKCSILSLIEDILSFKLLMFSEKILISESRLCLISLGSEYLQLLSSCEQNDQSSCSSLLLNASANPKLFRSPSVF